MPRPCSVCSHPAASEIDSSLVRRVAYRDISRRYSVSKDALSRHLNEHLSGYVQKALSERGRDKGVKVLGKLGSLVDRLDRFLDKAEDEEDGSEFRATAAELRKQLELVAKLQGELQQEGTLNIVNSPQYLRIEAVIVETLAADYPDAFNALLGAIEHVVEEEEAAGNALTRR